VVALIVVAGASIDGFYTLGSIRSELVFASLLGIAAAGQTLVVIVGGIDLSIPALMTLTDVSICELSYHHWNIAAALAVTGAVCVSIGALNGLLSRVLRVHPLIVTLGTSFMVSGVLLAWTQGNPVGSPPAFIANAAAASSSMGPIPFPPIVAVWGGVAVVMLVISTRTPLGRRMYAYGSSPSAAGYAQVRPRRLWMAVFGLSGLMAFVAGVMLAGYTGYGDLTSGDPYLFNSIAAVIVGGTSLLGGRGGYARTIAGALILTLAELILVGNGVSSSMQQVALGVIIVGFVVLYGREQSLSDRL
jgi:ribose transport system permease protein